MNSNEKGFIWQDAFMEEQFALDVMERDKSRFRLDRANVNCLLAQIALEDAIKKFRSPQQNA